MDRPPPTGYRDDAGMWHLKPGSEGYAEHLRGCWPCCHHVLVSAGEAWADAARTLLPEQLPPVPMPIPGPGMPRGQQALVQLRPQHAGLVVTGAIGCAAGVAVTLLLPPAVAVVVLVALLVGAAVVARIPHAAPRARLLRR